MKIVNFENFIDKKNKEIAEKLSKKDIVVCMSNPKFKLSDNLEGNCFLCGKRVEFRPHNKKLKKICSECFEREWLEPYGITFEEWVAWEFRTKYLNLREAG